MGIAGEPASINSAAGANSAARGASGIVGLAGSLTSSEITMWGLGFNQNIEAAALDLYVLFRNYDFEVHSTGGQKSTLEDLKTFTMGARQFVVHDALEKIVASAVITSSFTPKTTVFTSPVAGAEMTTLRQPALMCN